MVSVRMMIAAATAVRCLPWAHRVQTSALRICVRVCDFYSRGALVTPLVFSSACLGYCATRPPMSRRAFEEKCRLQGVKDDLIIQQSLQQNMERTPQKCL